MLDMASRGAESPSGQPSHRTFGTLRAVQGCHQLTPGEGLRTVAHTREVRQKWGEERAKEALFPTRHDPCTEAAKSSGRAQARATGRGIRREHTLRWPGTAHPRRLRAREELRGWGGVRVPGAARGVGVGV